MAAPAGVTPHHLHTPVRVNRVWHIDLLSLEILWFRFTVAAILDGFFRRLLSLRVYRRTPQARDMVALVRRICKESGKPRFIITDHGTQFRRQFRSAMRKMGIQPVQARVRAAYLNGKIERAFQTFRVWWRLVLTGLTQGDIQRRLDVFENWFNEHRPHSALHGLTPREAWEGHGPAERIPIRARDSARRHIEVSRGNCQGDPRSPVIEISVQLAA